MKLFNYQDYFEFGCQYTLEYGPAFAELYKPCKDRVENVCEGCFESGRCAPEKMMINRKNNQSYKPKSLPEKTNKMIADELGITKRQVVKLRQSGKLPAGYK